MERVYSLREGGNTTFKVAWSRVRKNIVEVRYDAGNSLIIEDLGDYQNGKEVLLANWKRIVLRLAGDRLAVEYQGKEIPCVYSPKYLISATLSVLGVLFIIAGLLGNLMQELPLGGFGASAFTAMAGAAFLFAAWLVNREENWAVGMAVLVLLAERSQAAISVYEHGHWPAMPIAALVLLGALLVFESRVVRRNPA